MGFKVQRSKVQRFKGSEVQRFRVQGSRFKVDESVKSRIHQVFGVSCLVFWYEIYDAISVC